jgi:aminopeptidase S
MKARGVVAGLLVVGCAVQAPASIAPTATISPFPTATAVPTRQPTASPNSESPLDGSGLATLIDQDSLLAHLEALQEIADAVPGGTRATGTPGFLASMRYVKDVLEAAGYRVKRQDFTVSGVPSANLLAEHRGSGEGVIMIGAHLDSVAAGPGINDNGSGVAALLVIASRLPEMSPPDRTIRFAFWGAEEGGSFGSAHYVESLTADRLAEIGAYLNFDMLASPNAVRFVYDEDDAPAGSDALTELFVSQLLAAGLAWDPIDVDGRSDHGPFAAAGIPISGLFSGGRELVTEGQAAQHGAIAGQPSDPCSDDPCDTIDNVDLATLEDMARIVARVLVDLATD